MSDWGPSPGASFAAGFAQGFAGTFVAGKQQQQREDADLVKFNLQRFVNKQDEYNKAATADNATVDLAKKYAEANGLPPDVWGNLYTDFKAGMTPNQIDAKIANGIYTPIKNNQPSVVTTETQVDSSTANQTDALLQEDPALTTNTTPGKVDTPAQNVFQRMGGFLSDAFDKDKQNKKREERVLAETLSKLEVEQSEYDRILSGYQSQTPEISYVYSAKKDPSKQPKWKSFANITVTNYIAMAAEAKKNKDETQSEAILNLGQLMKNETADFQDHSTLTSKNAPGRLLAAQVSGYTEVATTIENWMADPKNIDPEDVPNYRKFEQAVSKERTQAMIFAARMAGDDDAVGKLLTRLEEIDDTYPDQIDKKYIQSEYVRLSLAANGENATEDDKLAFQNFKNNTLPTFMEIYKRVNPSEQPLDFESAWNQYYQLKNDPTASQEEIDNALRAANGAISAMALKEKVEANAGALVSLVKINEDGTSDFVTSATPQFDAEGNTRYIDGYGSSLGTGYREVSPKEDQAREKVINALSTRVKAYDTNFVTATGAMRLYGELADMVIQDDRVLFATSGAAKKGSNALKELKNGLNIIGSVFQANQDGDLPEEITPDMVERRLQQQGILAQGQSLEQAASINTLTLGDNVEDLAKKKAAFNAKLILMAFRAGGLEGQTGMAMSNKDFDRLKEVVNASQDGQTFVTELGKYVQGRINTLKDDASLLQNDAGRASFKNRYGYDPYAGNGPVTEWSSLTEEGAEMDPGLQRGFEILAGNYTFGEEKPTGLPIPNSSHKDFMRDSVGTDQFESTKQFFITKFGQSAYDALSLETN